MTVLTHTVVMPGLWDSHTHVLGFPPGSSGYAEVAGPAATRAARATDGLRRALDAGITSVRELGGLGLFLAPVVEEGLLVGPTIYAAGSVLSVTGGHGDVHTFPVEWVHGTARMGADFRLADGEAECAKVVREQLRRNAKIIKVCASGGVMSEIDDPIHQQFTLRELRTVVEVAGLAERSVAAHCHGKPGIMSALEAGVLTIEHGTYLDDEACAAMKETGAILVPTLTILQEVLSMENVQPQALRKLNAIVDVHRENVTRAYEAGVKIAMGSDVGMTGDGPASWGRNGLELELLAEENVVPEPSVGMANYFATVAAEPLPEPEEEGGRGAGDEDGLLAGEERDGDIAGRKLRRYAGAPLRRVECDGRGR